MRKRSQQCNRNHRREHRHNGVASGGEHGGHDRCLVHDGDGRLRRDHDGTVRRDHDGRDHDGTVGRDHDGTVGRDHDDVSSRGSRSDVR